MSTFSVVIPALDEEESIAEVIGRTRAIAEALRERGFTRLEVIVVDDGSADRTAELAIAAGARVLRHGARRGYGAALKTGFAAATGEWLGFLDADGTYPPELFPGLLEAALARRADIAVGSRFGGEASGMPWPRRVGNRLFALLVTLISGSRVTDSASGMRVFRRSALDCLYPLPTGLNLTPVMTTRALHERLAITELPIPYDRRAGRSKLSIVRDGAVFAQSIVWTALSYNPARLLGLVAAAFGAAALAVAATLVALRLRGVVSLGPLGVWATFTAVVLAVASVSVAGLGASFGTFVALFRSPAGAEPRHAVRMARWERSLGWIGAASLVAGVAVSVVTLALGWRGWGLQRTWLYYLFSACLCLVGTQLVISWIQTQVLLALRERDQLIRADLESAPAEEAPLAARSAGLEPAG